MTHAPLDVFQAPQTPDQDRQDLWALASRIQTHQPTIARLRIQERLAQSEAPSDEDLTTWPDIRRQWTRHHRAALLRSLLGLILTGMALWWLFTPSLACPPVPL